MTPAERAYNDRVVAAITRRSTLENTVAELHPDFDETRRSSVVDAILAGCQVYTYRDGDHRDHCVYLDQIGRAHV